MTAKNSNLKPDYKEISLWARYNKDEALVSQLIILREYLDNDKSIKAHAVCMLDGLVDKLINDQVDMITDAKLPF